MIIRCCVTHKFKFYVVIVACLWHAGLGLLVVCPTLRDFVACEGLIGCRVFDTYVLLAHPRALDLHYRACADVVPLALRIGVACRVPHTARLRRL